MNLKLNAAILLVGCAVGYFLANKFKPVAPDAPPAVKASGSASVKKVTKPNGEVTETLECASQAEAKPSQPVVIKKNYSVGLVGLKGLEAVSVDARLGNLPVFVGAIVNQKLEDSKIHLRMEF